MRFRGKFSAREFGYWAFADRRGFLRVLGFTSLPAWDLLLFGFLLRGIASLVWLRGNDRVLLWLVYHPFND